MNSIKATDVQSPDAYYYSKSVVEVRKNEKDVAVPLNLWQGTADTKRKEFTVARIGLFSTDCLWGLKQKPFFFCLFSSAFHFHLCRVPVPTPSACRVSVSLDLK